MLLAGCRGRGLLSSDVVAQVGKTVLTEEDVTAAVPAGMSGEDSLAMVENYVETWVRRQVKLQEAEFEGQTLSLITHLRAHETGRNLVCRLLLEKKNLQAD